MREYTSREDLISDGDSWGEQSDSAANFIQGPSDSIDSVALVDGRWPGSTSTPRLSQFVAIHFQSNWQAYGKFEERVKEQRDLDNHNTEIYIHKWRVRDADDGDGKPAAVEDRQG